MSSTQKICHFLPSKYTCLAYDKENSLLAVGCETGEIAILREKPREIDFLPVPTSSSVEILSFAVGKGLLLTVLKNDSTLYLWNVNKKSLEHSLLMQKFSNEELLSSNEDLSSAPVDPTVTCVTWSEHNYFYVGTDTGTVKILQVHEVMENDETKYVLVWSSDSFKPESLEDSFKGNVTAIQEKIPDKSTSREVLLVSSNGHCVLWTWSAGKLSTCKKVATKDSLISAWWSPTGNITTAQNDGKITVIINNIIFSSKDEQEVDTAKSTIYKIKPVKIGTAKEEYLIYAVESTEEGVKQPRRILSLHTRMSDIHAKKAFNKPLVPFGGKIVDFECLATDQGKPSVLAVLTESELVVLETIDSDPTDKYLGVRQSHKYPYLTSPVTCLQHCGLCTKYFMKYMKQVMAGHSVDSQDKAIESDKCMPIELIATGHCDGSVRLWLCNVNTDSSFVSFKCDLVVYTAEYFELDDFKLKEFMQITLVKVSSLQKHMNVVNKSGRVLLFKFSPQQQKNPQSQEIVLKNEQVIKDHSSAICQSPSLSTEFLPPPVLTVSSSASDYELMQTSAVTNSLPVFRSTESWEQLTTASIPPTTLLSTQPPLPPSTLPTPPPHFCPCQWQNRHVQLLQHFSCHYQSGSDEPLKLVTVNCVDYNEEMGIWSVGTEKGLVILDLPENLLLDVIGSEAKLLRKSAGLKNKGDSENCNVKCVETVPKISLSKAAQQTSLWVATAGNALGVFTVGSSESTKEMETGEGKIESAKLVDILHCQLPNSDDVIVVVVTKKQVQSNVYPLKKSSKYKKNLTSDIFKSGIIWDGDVPHVILLDEKNHLHILSLPELTQPTKHVLKIPLGTLISKSSLGKLLFSSGGQHAVWCSERAVHCYYPF